MMSFVKKVFLMLCVVMFSVCDAHADEKRVVVNINEGVMKPINIALYLNDGIPSLKDRFLSVVTNDLQNTGLFRAIPNGALCKD